MTTWKASATVPMMLTRFRRHHGLTERRLAELLGKPGQAGLVTVNRWSTGARLPSRRMLELALVGLEMELPKVAGLAQ